MQRAGSIRVVACGILKQSVRVDIQSNAKRQDRSEAGNALAAFQTTDELHTDAGTLRQFGLREMCLAPVSTNPLANQHIVNLNVQ